jgi:hypothetical protein
MIFIVVLHQRDCVMRVTLIPHTQRTAQGPCRERVVAQERWLRHLRLPPRGRPRRCGPASRIPKADAVTAALNTRQSHVEIEQSLPKDFPRSSMDVGASVIDAATRGQVT